MNLKTKIKIWKIVFHPLIILPIGWFFFTVPQVFMITLIIISAFTFFDLDL